MQIVAKHRAAVFVIVAEITEVLPVAAVSGIVIVIAVFVMNSQQVEVGKLKLAPAFGTDPAVQFERALTIVHRRLGFSAQTSHRGINFSLTLGRLRSFIAWTKSVHIAPVSELSNFWM